MEQIIIVHEDRVGLVADIAELLGRSSINIEALAGDVQDGKAYIQLAVREGTPTTAMLKARSFNVLPSREGLTAGIRPLEPLRVRAASAEKSAVTKKGDAP